MYGSPELMTRPRPLPSISLPPVTDQPPATARGMAIAPTDSKT